MSRSQEARLQHTANPIDLMFTNGASLEEVVKEFPKISLRDLQRRTQFLVDTSKTSDPESELIQDLTRSMTQKWIDSLYPNCPEIARRLDRELNPDIE